MQTTSIVPFFTDSTYASTGIFAEHWFDLVEQVISMPETRKARSRRQRLRVCAENPGDRDNRLVTESATREKGAPGTPPKPSSNFLNNVVLSWFSRGRVLATIVSYKGQVG
jgi:hypothetical protein